MDWKIVLPVLLAFMLVFSVCAGCTQRENEAVEAVRKMAEELPGVEEFKLLDADGQLEAYNATQAAWEAYMALTEEQRALLNEERSAIEALFAYYNTLIMPLE